MEEKKNSIMETTTLTPVPASERKPWYNIAFIWAGSVICIPALMVGSLVSSGLNFRQSVIAMIIGYCIVVAYMCLLGMMSSDLGLPTTVAISRAYGSRGSSLLVSLIIAITMTGWFGSQTALCATSFCNIMSGYLHVNFPLWLSALIWGCLMFITSVYGVKMIEILNKISVPALFVMLIWGIISAIMNGAAGVVSSYEPPAFLGMTYGITLSVAGFASGAICCGDYTRYNKDRKGTILGCVMGVLPAGIGALVIGAVLSLSAGSYDLSVVFSNFGLPIIGMLVLILATWTTNTSNAYSSGIAVVNMFKMKDDKRSAMTLVCGAIGTALALFGIADVFSVFLNIIAVLVPPVAGVAIADYWIMGKGKPELWKPMEGINWMGVISWVVGGLVTYFTTFFVPTINGIIAALLLYCILAAIIKDEKVNPIYALKLQQHSKVE
ncbi:cytosine permease [Lutispora sp.]|uniref:cytosine permease n=1 Tax=Lutispora sp. TaxID=2828727 RepID=UPI002B203E0C|nr:cytosine permease [Lutispora sp.]MEA4963138.1 cytosine permease [Lutispora sp.]